MGRSPTKIVHDAWDTYVCQLEEGPLFVAFDFEAASEDLTGTLPHCARVLIPIREPNQNGGPVSPEAERLYEMEDELCSALAKAGVDCREVGRLTHAGTRELVFQLDDWEAFRPPVAQWMAEQFDYEIDVSEHDGWEFFNDCIRPTEEVWLYLGDQSVVRNLLEAGSNPEKEHAIEFCLCGAAKGLQAAAAALQERQFTPCGKLDFRSGEIVMVKQLPLDVETIFAESMALRELANELGIEYDGWGAAVVQ
jgi:regulator of RNase E activity RraB